MSYTLAALIKDVSTKRGKSHAKDNGGEAVDYGEVWNTFIRYAKSCLDQKRGLQLQSFCKIGWQVEKKFAGGGEATYRPSFQITDQFGRAYASQEGMRKMGAAPSGEVCPFEDFNFSKAAIKFSQNLTKDNVFSGLRALIQQLGESMADGREIDIEFGDVGRLTAREREPRFHFAAQVYHSEGLEAPSGAPIIDDGPRSGPAFSKQAPQESLGLGLRGSAAPQKQAAQQAPPTPIPEEAPYYGDEGNGYPQGGMDYREPTPQRMASPAPSSVPSQAMGAPANRSHILTGAQYKREVAFKESMDRHIGEMEARAGEAMNERSAWSRHVGDCLSQERDDIILKRNRQRENQHFVQQQKLLNEEKRKESRQEDIIAASAHDFPKFTEPAEQDMKDFITGQQARMRSDLDEQVRTNNTLRNLSKQRERSMELNQLEANRSEMSMLRDAERAKKTYDREALATAWNSEIRMKNIWKAIDSHNKVGSHEGAGEASVPPSRGGQSIRSAGSRILTGSQRKRPLGASSSLARLQGN